MREFSGPFNKDIAPISYKEVKKILRKIGMTRVDLKNHEILCNMTTWIYLENFYNKKVY